MIFPKRREKKRRKKREKNTDGKREKKAKNKRTTECAMIIGERAESRTKTVDIKIKR